MFLQRYSQYTDPYHGVPRLDLYQFNGAPLPPLYLVYKPPQMVPTTTLHPTAGVTATSRSKLKRSLDQGLKLLPNSREYSSWLDADKWWWFGVGMTGVGSVLYYYF
jgi:hypothetical protein